MIGWMDPGIVGFKILIDSFKFSVITLNQVVWGG